MDEKLNTLRKICNTAGYVALLIYIMLCSGGMNSGFLMMRVIISAIAVTAFSIRCGAEAMSDEKIENTFCIIVVCLFNLLINAFVLMLV